MNDRSHTALPRPYLEAAPEGTANAHAALPDRSSGVLRQLQANEQACLRRNVVVRVDSVSPDGRVALCSVGQCLHGLFRRSRSSHELVWLAERALAPLSAIGAIPLISVLPKPADDNLHGAGGPGGWPAALWQWMGHPLARQGYGHRVLVRDPFGWLKARAASEHAPSGNKAAHGQ